MSYIAAQLKRSKSSINYELKYCKRYNDLLAQADYEAKRENCGASRSVSQPGRYRLRLVQTQIRLVARRYRRPYWKTQKKLFSISVSSIYRYAALGLFKLSLKLLIRKGRKLKNSEVETRGKMTRLKRFMHTWHRRDKSDIGKSIQSSHKSHKSQILRLTERTTRIEIIYKLVAKTAIETTQVIIQLLKNLQKKLVKSIKADRVKEFHG